MKSALDSQIAKTREQVLKSLLRLEKSFKKTSSLSTQTESLSDDDLESWESLLARFARTIDLFSSKYIRLRVLEQEPGFRGSTRDHLNLAEKLGLIDSAEAWAELKELRNRQAHDYEDGDLTGLFEAVQKEIPRIMKIRDHL